MTQIGQMYEKEKIEYGNQRAKEWFPYSIFSFSYIWPICVILIFLLICSMYSFWINLSLATTTPERIKTYGNQRAKEAVRKMAKAMLDEDIDIVKVMKITGLATVSGMVSIGGNTFPSSGTICPV